MIERDIYRAAKLLVDRHGDDAPVHAAMRADAFLNAGDIDAAAAWQAITRATRDLLQTEPGRLVH